MTRQLGDQDASTADDLQREYGRLVNELEAASILGTTPRTLQSWRQENRGPMYVKLGSAHNAPVRYPVRHLHQYIRKHTVEPAQDHLAGLSPAITTRGSSR